MKAAGALVLLVVLGGCFDGGDGGGGDGDNGPPDGAACEAQAAPAEPEGQALDDESIMAWAQQIVHLPNGSLRPRVPSGPGHACTADWLEAALQVPGWDVVRSDFTGEDYAALDRSRVQGYIDHSGYCGEQDAAEVPRMALTNLAAVWRGGGDDRRTLLLAAHWDAKEDHDEGGGPVPAANDGASGMAVLLALQRHIASENLSFAFDVAVALFDAEDGFEDCHPLAGSLHFAQTMPIRVDRLILLDMVGDPAARFPRESHSVQSDPALVDLIWSLAPEHGLGENFVAVQKSVVDDHLPFIDVGVPSVDIIDFARPAGQGNGGFPPYWHTPHDTVDKLDGGFMADIARLLLGTMAAPSFAEPWPE